MAIQETNWDVIQNDTWKVDISVKDSEGSYIDFSDFTFEMEVRDKDGGRTLCATASLGDGITVTGLGMLKVELSPEKTKVFNFPKSKYQIQSIDSNGRRNTILTGWFNVKAGVIE
jgi:hypothetical protein